MKFKQGDFITEGEKVGVIVSNYRNNDFDWEVYFLTGSHTGCYQDCAKSESLKKYDWKPYPKTWKQIFNLIINKLRGKK